MAVAAAALVASAAGSLLAGNSEKNALDYNAEVQKNNATGALLTAKLNADKQSLISNKVIGSAQAAYGASGVSADSGSVFSVLGASAASAEMDRQNVLYGGQIRAVNSENQASLDEISAGNAQTGSYFKAAAGVTRAGATMYGNSIAPEGGGGGGGGWDNVLGTYNYGGNNG